MFFMSMSFLCLLLMIYSEVDGAVEKPGDTFKASMSSFAAEAMSQTNLYICTKSCIIFECNYSHNKSKPERNYKTHFKFYFGIRQQAQGKLLKTFQSLIKVNLINELCSAERFPKHENHETRKSIF